MRALTPNQALQRFDRLGKPGAGFTAGKGLAKSQPNLPPQASQLSPAGASRLPSLRPARRVAELRSLGRMTPLLIPDNYYAKD